MAGLRIYSDVAAEVAAELARTAIARPKRPGSTACAIALDPGIGFAKTRRAQRRRAARLGVLVGPRLPHYGRSVAQGVHRHAVRRRGAERAGAGSIAAGLFALSQGASILRVHDVAATVQAVRVWQGAWQARPWLVRTVEVDGDMSKRRLFGTDGIRGTANIDPMTAETALAAGPGGRAAVHARRPPPPRRDRQGHAPVRLHDRARAGRRLRRRRHGRDLVGPLPTPAIAMLTRSLRADLGVMISASHNPFEDNGIKLFGPDGFKLSDETEREIEALMAADRPARLAPPTKLGRASRLDDAAGRYIEAAKATFPRGLTLDGLQDRRRLRQRRRLPRGAHRAVGAGRRPSSRSASSPTASTSTMAAAPPCRHSCAARSWSTRRRSRHRARRRRGPAA